MQPLSPQTWTDTQRNAAFVVACLGTRTALTLTARGAAPDTLRQLGQIAVVPAVGFALIYALRLRTTGAEVQGQAIWWNHLRPLHALLWGAFAHQAMRGNTDAWRFLAADTALGANAWYQHRFTQTQ
jgi:hypothetical protein